MNNLKKTICCALVLGTALGMVGCTDKVQTMMDNKEYEQAYEEMLKNPEKYTDTLSECKYYLAKDAYDNKNYSKAYELLEDNNFSKAQKLLKEIKPIYNTVTDITNIQNGFNYIINQNNDWLGKDILVKDNSISEAYDCYFLLANRISDIISNIDNNTYEIDNSSKEIKFILGYIPKDMLSLREDLTNLQKYFISDINRYPISKAQSLFATADNSYTTTYIDSNNLAHMIVINPHDLIKENKISANSIACILGLFKSYGAEILFNEDSIDIQWSESTRGYDYCAPNDQREELTNFLTSANCHIELVDLVGTDGICNFIIENPIGYRFDFMAINVIIMDPNMNYINTDYERVSQISGNPIIIQFKIPNAQYDVDYQFDISFTGVITK